LVLGRRLHWQVGRLLTAKDASDITRCTPILVEGVDAIGNQAAGRDIEAFRVDRGELVLASKRYDQLAMMLRPGSRCDDESATGRAREIPDLALDFRCFAYIDRTDVDLDEL